LNLKISTLSEYLSGRYGESISLLYSVTMLILIIVQLTAAFYIGSRTLTLVLKDSYFAMSYNFGVWVLVFVTASYTIIGGLKAVVLTDVFQSFLLLIAGIVIAVLTFRQPEIGGFFSFLNQQELAPLAEQKMHLYLPSDHPNLPWTGAISGLMILHIFFWGTNQYLVQRALAAKSLKEARIGALTGGFLKMLVPFFSVAGGVAAARLFQVRHPEQVVASDDVFSYLVDMVVPSGYGIIGIITAGLFGAIVSSIDSMTNSASTLFTIDIYKKYINKNASDKNLVRAGRGLIIAIVSFSALLAMYTYDPRSKENFFLVVSRQSSYFTPGLVAAFFLGMFSKKANSKGALLAILACFPMSLAINLFYNNFLSNIYFMQNIFGDKMNFMHRTLIVFIFCVLIILFTDSKNQLNKKQEGFLWEKATSSSKDTLSRLLKDFFIFLSGIVVIFSCIAFKIISTKIAALFVFPYTLLFFIIHLKNEKIRMNIKNLIKEDRFYAGLLSSFTMSIMCYFY